MFLPFGNKCTFKILLYVFHHRVGSKACIFNSEAVQQRFNGWNSTCRLLINVYVIVFKCLKSIPLTSVLSLLRSRIHCHKPCLQHLAAILNRVVRGHYCILIPSCMFHANIFIWVLRQKTFFISLSGTSSFSCSSSGRFVSSAASITFIMSLSNAAVCKVTLAVKDFPACKKVFGTALFGIQLHTWVDGGIYF